MPLGCPSTNAIAQAWASRPKFITDTHSVCFRALSQHQTQAIELCSKWLLLPTRPEMLQHQESKLPPPLFAFT